MLKYVSGVCGIGGVEGRIPIYEDTREAGRRRGVGVGILPSSLSTTLSSTEKLLGRSLIDEPCALRPNTGLNQSAMLLSLSGCGLRG